MRLLVDMNLSPMWIPFLSQNGFPAVHWSEIGVASARDSEIMSYAATNGFIVLTHDLDFGTLLAAGKTNAPSVIQIRAQDITPDSFGACC